MAVRDKYKVVIAIVGVKLKEKQEKTRIDGIK